MQTATDRLGSSQFPSTDTTERLLVTRAQRGETDAMQEILVAHADRVERLARGIVKNPMDAEEVVQDVFVAVTKKIDRFRGDAALSTWIHRITVNTAVMHLRRDRSSRMVSLENQPGRGRRDVDSALRDEFWDVVWQAVDGLDEKHRTAFLLRAVDGLSMEAAARCVGLKVPAFKSRLHRARLDLRAGLGGYFDGAGQRPRRYPPGVKVIHGNTSQFEAFLDMLFRGQGSSRVRPPSTGISSR
ncbi:MAG TPA: sigma-70 family RNA polymerase sigma factor [Candidatus Latescibacteria bacterium]|jgi:RNA polymerase sigma-70 factor (ECF subfamily)|nr:RNA polymerase subunit sigma-24 [Gemmatimonadaceae bacterium]MDP6015256.1 sigma-70 family RNA polymerase sigma factor [Candidatus Latescibacterota bacterium]HJP31652.1 sigma-70 family RNA polymerase sigma factor [Candidatus Latescibacterota bacterium]